MLVLVMCLATVIALEDSKIEWGSSLVATTGLTLFLAGAIGFMPSYRDGKNGSETYDYGLMDNEVTFWIHTAIAVGCLVILAVMLKFIIKKKKLLPIVSIALVCAISTGYTLYIVGKGKTYGYDSKNYMNALVINHKSDIDLPNSDNVRTDFYEMMDNSGMHWQIPTIQAFHSVVPGSVMEFYNNVGVQRDVGSRPQVSEYAVRSLLSTKWLVDYCGDSQGFSDENGVTAMPGWSYYDKQSEFDIWENEYYIPMGFCYDEYMLQESYEECDEMNRTKLMLKAMVLTKEQADKYSFVSDKLKSVENYRYMMTDYFTDCKNRRAEACSVFEYTENGFRAEIDRTGKSENTLLFFSVPYEDGWTAMVNGKPVDIEKVNVGFMAVEVPADRVSEITFQYKTPGLKTGFIVTIVSFAVFAVYMLIIKRTGYKPLKQSRKYRIVKNELTFTEKAKLKEAQRRLVEEK